MDKLEKKKWLILRADIVFSTRRQMLREKEKEFEQFRDFEINRWKKIEKGVITGVVIASGIIFGIHSIDEKIINAISFLSITLLFGVSIYIPTLIFRYANEKIFDEILSSDNASRTWHRFYGFFNRCAIKIEQYDAKDFEKFLEYFDSFGMTSAELSFYTIVKKTNKSWYKRLLLSMSAIQKLMYVEKTFKQIFDKQSIEYEIKKKNYENLPILEKFLIYGNALTRYKNGIIIPNFCEKN